MKQLLVMLALSILVLSGCATLNKDECLTADWYQIGYEDGARGYADTRISSHREACAKHGITPDFRDYQDGHEEGVIRFCTPSNGFIQGKKGYQYTGLCPTALEDGFLDGYDAGHKIYAVTSEVRTLSSELSQNERQIDIKQQEIIDKTNLMLADGTTQADRYALNSDISQMQQDLGALEERNKQINIEMAEANAKLSQLEARYAFY